MIKFLFGACLIGVGAVYTEKQYPVAHTVPEWQTKVTGLAEVQRVIHTSDLPAKEAFYCDSVLQSQIMDISRQVNAGMIADSSKTKK